MEVVFDRVVRRAEPVTEPPRRELQPVHVANLDSLDNDAQKDAAMRLRGVVKWFNPRKGYGFITRPDEPDIFVHYSQIAADGFRLLEDGQAVEFTLADGEKGLHAREVVAVNGA